MTRRAIEIAGFLVQNGWGDAHPTPVAADLSPRRYARLDNGRGQVAILMDADEDQKTPQFLSIARILRQCGIQAPEIFAADPPRGLVLMQDIGARNFGAMIDEGGDKPKLYRRAIDVLVQLHKSFKKELVGETELPTFNAALFAKQAGLFLEAYLPYALGRAATDTETDHFSKAWLETLQNIETQPQTLLLRDYMPDNLMDLSGEMGLAATGVLDFQDAGLGPIAYDVASLCEVARRDGGDALLDEMIGYYYDLAKPAVSMDRFSASCRILAAQRHTRILGLLVAHAQRTGRHDKLSWLPRTKKYLSRLLESSELHAVNASLAPVLAASPD